MVKKIVYRLYGIVNLFNKVPSFVYPVFERNGNFYYGHCDDSDKYTHFEIIEYGDTIQKIRPLNNITSKTIVGFKGTCSIGDPVVYAMEQQKNTIYLATIDKMMKTLENYQTSDEDFRHSIDVVKNEIAHVKKLKR